ncbi:MAG TPA: hypothetical protein VN914_17270 [Polyangia bacterium]|nr:hypothetical protein [Polyangia bacterium]
MRDARSGLHPGWLAVGVALALACRSSGGGGAAGPGPEAGAPDVAVADVAVGPEVDASALDVAVDAGADAGADLPDAGTDGGDTGAASAWTRWPLPGAVNLRDVWAAGAGEAWAVGEEGTALHFVNGSWQSVATGVITRLDVVVGSAPDDVWAGGEGPTLLHWDGMRWNGAPAPSQMAIVDLAVVSRKEAYLLAVDRKGVFRFDGSAWTLLSDRPSALAMPAIWSPGPGRLWLAGAAGIFTWNGKGWVLNVEGPTVNVARYQAMHGSGPDQVWVVGQGSGWQAPAPTQWDGTGWSRGTEHPSLSAVWSRHAGDAWATALDGAIWHFEGFWTEARVSTRPLRSIHGTREGRVWAVGDAGEIWYHDPAPAELGPPVKPVPPPDPSLPRNACGGTAPLSDLPGAACAPCGVTWVCAELDRLLCRASHLNACGGCGRINQAVGNPFPESPLASCGAGHWYVCDDEDTLGCTTSLPKNVCGGAAPLVHEVGERCGASADCRYACRGGDSVCLCDRRDAGP